MLFILFFHPTFQNISFLSIYLLVLNEQKLDFLSWVVGLRPIVCMWDLSLQGIFPPWGIFLRDPSPYLSEFRRNHGKLRTARSTSATGFSTWYLPSSSLERYHSAICGTTSVVDWLAHLLPSAGNRKTDTNPSQPWLLRALMRSTQIWLFVH